MVWNFWPMVMLNKKLLDEIHEGKGENRWKSLNKDLNKLMKETGKRGLEEFARLPGYVNMHMQWSQIRVTDLIHKC